MPAGGSASPVVVRFYAAAREAAGTDRLEVSAGSVREVLDEVVRIAGPALARVLSVATVLVDGVRMAPDEPLAGGSTVEVLPPFAGG